MKKRIAVGFGTVAMMKAQPAYSKAEIEAKANPSAFGQKMLHSLLLLSLTGVLMAGVTADSVVAAHHEQMAAEHQNQKQPDSHALADAE